MTFICALNVTWTLRYTPFVLFFFWGGGGVKLCKTQPEGMAHVLSVVSAFLSSDCFFKVKFGLPLKFWHDQ